MGLNTAYAKDTVVVTARGASVTEGHGTYAGSGVSVLARVIDKSGVLKSADGTEFVFSVIIYFNEDATLTLEDKVVTGGVEYYIKDIREVKAIDNTVDHYKVWCG